MASKLTKARVERILELVELGAFKQVAAAEAGICEKTLYNWIERGRKAKNGLLKRLHDGLMKAEALAEIRAITVIQKAARDGVWQAAAWYLERVHPDRYSQRKLEVKHSGEVRTGSGIFDAIKGNPKLLELAQAAIEEQSSRADKENAEAT